LTIGLDAHVLEHMSRTQALTERPLSDNILPVFSGGSQDKLWA
jgi:hypothetical protein